VGIRAFSRQANLRFRPCLLNLSRFVRPRQLRTFSRPRFSVLLYLFQSLGCRESPSSFVPPTFLAPLWKTIPTFPLRFCAPIPRAQSPPFLTFAIAKFPTPCSAIRFLIDAFISNKTPSHSRMRSARKHSTLSTTFVFRWCEAPLLSRRLRIAGVQYLSEDGVDCSFFRTPPQQRRVFFYCFFLFYSSSVTGAPPSSCEFRTFIAAQRGKNSPADGRPLAQAFSVFFPTPCTVRCSFPQSQVTFLFSD